MDFLRALLVLVPIWWMYGGYVWLTNNVRANFVVATIFRRERRFTLNAAHFAERHGGIILIALGESVIAIAMGASASNPAVKGEWLVGVVLSLVLVASLWWSYFDREDRRAAQCLVAAARRSARAWGSSVTGMRTSR
jgi:low temperature requirement protein LtrA